MSRNFIFLVIISFLVINSLGCTANANKETAQETQNQTLNQKKSLDLAIFQGNINQNIPFTMFLVQRGQTLEGFYHYDKYLSSIDLEGEINTDGTVKLNEKQAGEITAVFQGNLKSGQVEGVWKNAENGKEMAFTMSKKEVGDFSDYFVNNSGIILQKSLRKEYDDADWEVVVNFPYVVLEKDNPVVNKLNAKLQSSAQRQYSKGLNTAEETPEKEGHYYEIISEYTLVKHLLSYQIDRDERFGNSLGYEIIETNNFDLKTGEKVQLSDLFPKNNAYLKEIAGLCTAELEKSFPEKEFDEEGLKPTAENYKVFFLNEEGITFVFNKHLIGWGTAGDPDPVPSVFIPYGELEMVDF